LMNNYNNACENGKLMRMRAIDNYDIIQVAETYINTIESVVNGR
jgi:hypothetical protein